MNETIGMNTSGVFAEIDAASSDYFLATFQNKISQFSAIASSLAALLIILPGPNLTIQILWRMMWKVRPFYEI